ncbi:MAG: Ribokinase [uncultured Rubrobacteraceae bacterium]|uniref:Ribokinase n=1 Tax=uncultured Rubrobacteraceae bacterium TaxID=349277 RepID=A0A6J4QYD0_9ACTN|nr:MAG: Ribokinase [uncultured Rubrobacteraceae bacterium]
MAEVFVVGSINQDFVLQVERRPEPGETVTDAELALFPGGKGANQAIAAARLEAEVAILGRVGEDTFGAGLVKNLRDNNVDTSHVEAIRETPTGSAFITVTPDGENAIVVSPGANRRFGADEVEAAAGELREARVLVAQLEVQVEAVEAAAHIVSSNGGRFLFNTAPPRDVSEELLQLCDPLVVNQHEAAFLLGDDIRNPEETARKLLDLGPSSVVVTLGAAGVVLAAGDSTRRFSAPEVEAVDTTGAGDAFVGALAAKLAADTPLEEAVPYAVLAGAFAVTRSGAQGSLPSPDDVEKLSGAGPAR